MGLAEQSVPGLGLDGPSVPAVVVLETEHDVDDIHVELTSGARLNVQAKRRVDFGADAFKKSVDQWVRAAKAGIDPTAERVVLASGSLSGPIRELSEALDRRRRRVATKPSRAEAEAFSRLESLLTELSEDEKDALLSSIVILELDVEDPNGAHTLAAVGLLSGTVVESASAARAWQVLVGEAWNMARKRYGDVIEGWLMALKRANVPLVSDQPGMLASNRVQTWAAVARYREDVFNTGSVIDLRQIGVDVEPLPVLMPGAQIEVEPHVGAGRSGLDRNRLSASLRRRGRMILTGLPGAGKTVALQQVCAARALDEREPLPFYVRLKDVSDRLRNGAIDRAVIEAALLRVRPGDRDLIEAEMRRRLSTGEATLLFDSLDETADSRHDLVRLLSNFVSWIDSDVEIVISTRDVAHAAARTLGWPDLRLMPPPDLDETLRSLAWHLAAARDIPSTERESWVSIRLAWLEEQKRRIPTLSEVPLFPMLLVVLLADHEPTAVPRSRGEILSLIVGDIAGRLDLRRWTEGTGLSLEEVDLIRRRSFNQIGHALYAPGPPARASALDSTLAEVLQRDWGWAPAMAQARAQQARRFWDEAGVFVAEGAGEVVSARTRLLAEIAEAGYAADLGAAEQIEWTRYRAGDPDAHEVLRLAVDLSATIAEEVLALAEERNDLTLAVLLARSFCDLGATDRTPQVRRLIDMILSLLPSSTALARYQLAEALARLPVPLDLQDQVLEAVAGSLSDRHNVVIQALAVLAWGLSGRGPDRVLLRALRADEPPQLGPQRGIRDVDSAYVMVLIGSAERLLPERRWLAPIVAKAMGRGSMRSSGQLYNVLVRHGHRTVARNARIKTLGNIAWMQRLINFDDGWTGLLRILCEFPGRDLTYGESRRLDDLADLVATIELGQAGMGDIRVALEQDPDGLRSVVRLIGLLGQLNMAAVSSQGRMGLALNEEDSQSYKWLTFDGGTKHDFLWTDDIDKAGERARLIELLSSPADLVAEPAYEMLLTCPQKVEGLSEIEAAIPGMTLRRRYLASHLMIALSSEVLGGFETWLGSQDPALRANAGRAFMMAYLRGTANLSSVQTVINDPDLWVRQVTMSPIVKGTTLPDELAAALRSVRADSAEAWSCSRCGSQNGRPWGECRACRNSPPGVSDAVAAVTEWPDVGRSRSVLG